METIVLAIAAVLLLAVQTHRNYLMVRASKRLDQPYIVVNVPEPNYESLAQAMEASWPTVTVSNDISHELDYNKLGEAVKMALIESGVALHNAQIPVIIPNPNPQPYSGPYWQTPVVSDSVGDVNVEASNESEINGIPGRKFPAR